MTKECTMCHKFIAAGMWWVHEEDHRKGRIGYKPTLTPIPATAKVFAGGWICRNVKGKAGIGYTPKEAYESWRCSLDY